MWFCRVLKALSHRRTPAASLLAVRFFVFGLTHLTRSLIRPLSPFSPHLGHFSTTPKKSSTHYSRYTGCRPIINFLLSLVGTSFFFPKIICPFSSRVSFCSLLHFHHSSSLLKPLKPVIYQSLCFEPNSPLSNHACFWPGQPGVSCLFVMLYFCAFCLVANLCPFLHFSFLAWLV